MVQAQATWDKLTASPARAMVHSNELKLCELDPIIVLVANAFMSRATRWSADSMCGQVAMDGLATHAHAKRRTLHFWASLKRARM